ncbi:hypothetical protein BX600DRAFT_505882 [Xylariales sp. PMI_506]|nr:hypothetical protein BX600DRAFT_505882 [Xylariales sp. PMI_506]
MDVSPKYSTQRTAGREHVPLYPKGFIAIRIIQLVLSLVVLGLSAYGVAYLVFSGDCLMLFTAIATFICCIYYIVAEFGAPAAYNYWAVLSLDIFLVIFWLISFALLASQIAPYMSGYTYYYFGEYYTVTLDAAEQRYADCLAAASGIGGLEFLLFLISLAVHSVMLHRHRKAGLHCMPAGSAAAAAAVTTESKLEAQPQVQQPQVAQGHPVYPQQYMPPQGYEQQTPVTYAAQPGVSVQGTPSPAPYVQQQVPQPSPSPVSAQPTGTSFTPSTQYAEVPAQHYDHGPYEAPANPVQPAQPAHPTS